jgi:hypothetical protein
LLPNGQVLVVGGLGTGSTELYDWATESWTATNSLSPGRFANTATLLRNGTVLVSAENSRYGILARAQLSKSAREALDIQ